MLKGAGMRSAIEAGQFSDELLDWMIALLRHTQRSPELLVRIGSPVYLFWGADGPFGGADSAREFADLLPNSELQMVAGAGHAPWLDEPELAAAAVQAHLSG